ncbi:pilus assembly protein CpaE [bacterium]|nr:pilus assembly protein CpaE [bacterium]
MSGVTRVAIVDPSDDSREHLRGCLLGMDTIWLEAECSRYEFFLDVIQQSTPDVAIVCVDSDTDTAMNLIRRLATSQPGVDLVAVSSRSDGQFILQTMRSGAKEFVSLPVRIEELHEVLDRLRTSRAGKDGDSRVTSRVYSFCGSRGGAGCTSLAVNFGTILSKNPSYSVAYIDLDLAMGDADVCLDIVPDYTLADVAINIDRIDLQLLKRSLSRHASGLYLLPHPVQIEDAALIQPEHITRVINLLKMTFTHIILDLSKGYRAIDFAAMQSSDEIMLVTQLDVSSLRNVVRVMLSLNDRNNLESKVRVVANRVGSSDAEISVQRAEETIGRSIFARIPNDSRTMLASRNSGVPLIEHAPKSKLFQSILTMTEQITGETAMSGSGEAAKSGVWSFFGAKK